LQIKFATYNIHKGVGLDGRRDPERIMAVLHELNADVVALQEADRRFGRREAVLSRSLLDEHHWHAAPVANRLDSIGWHGNALLVRPGIEVLDCTRIDIPTIEPRGAVCARLSKDGREFLTVGMHLDLSGLARKRQIRQVCEVLGSENGPCVMMGDLNEWSRDRGAFRSFGDGWHVLAPGLSFPSRRPVAMLDRIVHSPGWNVVESGIHHSALSARASDHLPAWACLEV
jgi:endonuclease/exonuclease/phosphatase family metal-dependent hydrolase